MNRRQYHILSKRRAPGVDYAKIIEWCETRRIPELTGDRHVWRRITEHTRLRQGDVIRTDFGEVSFNDMKITIQEMAARGYQYRDEKTEWEAMTHYHVLQEGSLLLSPRGRVYSVDQVGTTIVYMCTGEYGDPDRHPIIKNPEMLVEDGWMIRPSHP